MTAKPAPRIEAILLDFGGVLIELVGVEQMLDWCPELGGTDELWRRWLHSPAVRRFETGGSTREEFAAEIVGEFGLPVGGADFLRAFTHWPRALFPGVAELLAGLAPRCRLASVSNTNELHWERFEREWSLPGYFHHNFPSHQVGMLKPDAAYFRHVIEALAVDAGRVLFVDDNRINVDAATRLGIVARHAVGVDGLVAVLAEFNLHEGIAS
jgi:putative hydrolase of the HAD superfamily